MTFNDFLYSKFAEEIKQEATLPMNINMWLNGLTKKDYQKYAEEYKDQECEIMRKEFLGHLERMNEILKS